MSPFYKILSIPKPAPMQVESGFFDTNENLYADMRAKLLELNGGVAYRQDQCDKVRALKSESYKRNLDTKIDVASFATPMESARQLFMYVLDLVLNHPKNRRLSNAYFDDIIAWGMTDAQPFLDRATALEWYCGSPKKAAKNPFDSVSPSKRSVSPKKRTKDPLAFYDSIDRNNGIDNLAFKQVRSGLQNDTDFSDISEEILEYIEKGSLMATFYYVQRCFDCGPSSKQYHFKESRSYLLKLKEPELVCGDVYFYLGRLDYENLDGSGDSERALTWMKKASGFGVTEARYYLGTMLKAAGRPLDAIAYFKQLPDHVLAQESLAQIYVENGNDELAAEAYKRAYTLGNKALLSVLITMHQKTPVPGMHDLLCQAINGEDLSSELLYAAGLSFFEGDFREDRLPDYDRAFALFKQAGERHKDSRALYKVAQFHFEEWCEHASLDEAICVLKSMPNLSPEATLLLAQCLLRQQGRTPEVSALFQDAYQGFLPDRSPYSLYQKARCQLEGWCADASPEQGLQFCEEAAQEGLKEALHLKGMIYLGALYPGIADLDPALAKTCFQLAGEQGLAESWYQLGVLEDDGKALFEKAAKWGIVSAQLDYGVCCERDGDYMIAYRQYVSVAEADDPRGYLRLGDSYLFGRLGLLPDSDEAISRYEKALALGSEEARKRLIYVYLGATSLQSLDREKLASYLQHYSKDDVPFSTRILIDFVSNYQGTDREDRLNELLTVMAKGGFDWLVLMIEILLEEDDDSFDVDMAFRVCREWGVRCMFDDKGGVKEKADDDRPLIQVGISLALGWGVHYDRAAAIKMFTAAFSVDGVLPHYQKRAEQKDPDAMFVLGLCAELGVLEDPDLEKAQRLYQQLSEQHDSRGFYALGSLYLKAPSENFVSKKRAMDALLSAAAKGYIPAQVALVRQLSWLPGDAISGDHAFVDYVRGRECSKLRDGTYRFKEAFLAYSKAAKQGFAPAFIELALAHRDGLGTKPDQDKYQYWMKKAFRYGLSYLYSVEEDPEDPYIQYILAELYRGKTDESNEIDGLKSLYWMYLSAEKKCVPAMLQYGVYYRQNKQCELSRSIATTWLSKPELASHPIVNYLHGCDCLASKYDGAALERALRFFKVADDQGYYPGTIRWSKLILRHSRDDSKIRVALDYLNPLSMYDDQATIGLYRYYFDRQDYDTGLSFLRRAMDQKNPVAFRDAAKGVQSEYFELDDYSVPALLEEAVFLGDGLAFNTLCEMCEDKDIDASSIHWERIYASFMGKGFKHQDKGLKFAAEADCEAALVERSYESLSTDKLPPEECEGELSYLKDVSSRHAKAGVYVAWVHQQKKIPFQAETVMQLKRSADLGSAEAMSVLGDCYQHGLGVAVDHKKSLDWNIKAAKAGDLQAARWVGSYYFQLYKVGSETDKALGELALNYFMPIAKSGDVEAQFLVSELMNAVLTRQVSSGYWLRKAASNGSLQASAALVVFDRDEGVEASVLPESAPAALAPKDASPEPASAVDEMDAVVATEPDFSDLGAGPAEEPGDRKRSADNTTVDDGFNHRAPKRRGLGDDSDDDEL